MFANIFILLETIKSRLIIPNALITVEMFDMGNVSGLRFKFFWYYDAIHTKEISYFLPKRNVADAILDSTILESIIYYVNFELKKQSLS